MFLKHYGLREQPFGVTPDPGYLYFGASHREALASLFYGIETGCGFLSLIATPGMGKTTLLLRLLEQLRGTSQTVFLFQTQCNSREFMRYLLSDLGIQTRQKDLAQMHHSLSSFLLSNARSGWRFVLVIDEAQNLRNSVLETVRLLSDFEAPPRKLLQIVLSGQPELGDRLSKPELLQLRQRISIVSRLHPLPPAETPAYIDHRLRVAGYAGPSLFESEAIAQIATHSAGIPRNINNICFNALTLAYAKRQKHVDVSTVIEVVDDLNILASSSSNGTSESFSVDASSFPDAVKPEDQPLPEGLYSRTSASDGPEGTTSHSWRNPGMSSNPQFGESTSAVAVCDRSLAGNRTPTEQGTPSTGTDLHSLKPETPAGAPQEVAESALTFDPREQQKGTPATVMGASASAPSEDCVSARHCADKAVGPEPVQALAPNQPERISSRVAAIHTSDKAPKRFQVGAYAGPSEGSAFVRARWMSIAVCVSITLSCVFLLWRHAPQRKGYTRLPIVAAAQPSSTPMLGPPVDAENTPAKRPASKEEPGIKIASGRPAAIARPRRAAAGVISDTFGELNAHPSSKPAKIIPSSDPIVESSIIVAANMNAIIFSGGTQNLATPAAPPSRLDSGTPSEGDEDAAGPRLVHSRTPEYPERAKKLGVTGNVVVDVKIDENGNISKMKIISGSSLLRKDALNALREWKYAPAKPGVPRPPVDRVVTVTFRE